MSITLKVCVEWLCNLYCSAEGNIPESTNIDRKKKKKKKKKKFLKL